MKDKELRQTQQKNVKWAEFHASQNVKTVFIVDTGQGGKLPETLKELEQRCDSKGVTMFFSPYVSATSDIRCFVNTMFSSIKGAEGVGDLDNVGTVIIPRAPKLFAFHVPAKQCVKADDIKFSSKGPLDQQPKGKSQIVNDGSISRAEREVLVDTSQEPLSTHKLKVFDNPFRVDDHKYSYDSKTVTVVVYDARDKECKQPRFIGEVPLQKINNMWEKEIEFKTCEVAQQQQEQKSQQNPTLHVHKILHNEPTISIYGKSTRPPKEWADKITQKLKKESEHQKIHQQHTTVEEKKQISTKPPQDSSTQPNQEDKKRSNAEIREEQLKKRFKPQEGAKVKLRRPDITGFFAKDKQIKKKFPDFVKREEKEQPVMSHVDKLQKQRKNAQQEKEVIERGNT